tara:strand:- start:11 stop:187 length:177 start_codon:yes stop_codon:yes gene_type:complete
MKIIKLSDKEFKQLKKYVDFLCTYIFDKGLETNRFYLHELMEKHEPLFDLQESLEEIQ